MREGLSLSSKAVSCWWWGLRAVPSVMEAGKERGALLEPKRHRARPRWVRHRRRGRVLRGLFAALLGVLPDYPSSDSSSVTIAETCVTLLPGLHRKSGKGLGLGSRLGFTPSECVILLRMGGAGPSRGTRAFFCFCSSNAGKTPRTDTVTTRLEVYPGKQEREAVGNPSKPI